MDPDVITMLEAFSEQGYRVVLTEAPDGASAFRASAVDDHGRQHVVVGADAQAVLVELAWQVADARPEAGRSKKG